MTERERILGALPRASGSALRSPTYLPEERHGVGRTNEELWEQFRTQLEMLGGQMLPEGALPLLLTRGYFAEDAVVGIPQSGRVFDVWEADVGVTRGDVAVAELGSILVASGLGRSRLASLAPPAHVVLIAEASIVEKLDDAFKSLPAETCVLISGTSRTADIEGVLVRGVHGPRELYVVVQSRRGF